jgi:hypothetical protein
MLLVAIALALVVVPALVVLALRQWGRQDVQTESRLLSPDAHTLTYVVPTGQDPAPLRTALLHAHFSAVMGRGDAGDCLVVECDEGERDRIREIIEQTLLDSRQVHFQDEPA